MKGLRISEWVLAVLGAIAGFSGVFILVGGDDQYIGLGGEASWRVGDLSIAWGYGLAAGGLAVMLAAFLLFRRDRRAGVAHEPSTRADLAVHATVFVLVNAFVIIQDAAIGDGINYAWWLTIPWGIGLAAHAIAVLAVGGRHAPTH